MLVQKPVLDNRLLRSSSDATTTLTYTVSLGGEQIYQESVTEIVDEITPGQAMNFSGAENEINITANPGDVFTLSLSPCTIVLDQVLWCNGVEVQSRKILVV